MDLLIKIIEVLLANPLTVTLVVSGVVCVAIAIIGEIPTLKNPIQGSKAFALGFFGLLLIVGAIGMAWISAQAQLAQVPNPTSVPAQSSAVVTRSASNDSSPTPLPSREVLQVVQNLITENSNFENGTTGWQYDGRHQSGISIVSGHSGQAICSRQNLQANEAKVWVGIQYATLFPVTPGQTYTFAGWLKWDNATQFHIKVMWNDAPANWSAPLSIMDGNSNGWVFQQGSVTAPPGATTARLALWHGVENDARNVPGGEFCADELVFGVQK